MFKFEISPSEANYWWRKNEPVGALLNSLMFLFIFVPIALVFKKFYVASFLVFAFMVPYALTVRRLAVRAAYQHLRKYPEARPEFEEDGIISS